MYPPPVQLATTVEVPVNKSSAATTLSPGVPAEPRVAVHEIMVWVTSCGDQDPVSVQMVRGLRASVTSERIGVVEPCMTRRASRVEGVEGHVACIAAQAGTATGLGSGEGEGLGDGLGDGLGEGVGVGDGECEGVERATAGPFAAQPVMTSSAPARTNPLLTGI